MVSLRSRKRRPESTGHAGDDQLLGHLATASRLESPRHWLHYVLLTSRPDAQSVAGEIRGAGWVVQRTGRAADGAWVVIAEREDARLSAQSVRSARAFFEALSARYPGGRYEGWEASL